MADKSAESTSSAPPLFPPPPVGGETGGAVSVFLRDIMKKILLIEDEELIRNSLVKMLKAEGFEAIGAENGSVGVYFARTAKPDLIVCDLMMPELDGYGVLNILQQDRNTAGIPFICLTAQNDRASQRQVMELGANDYLTKPFSPEELLGTITTQLSKQQRLKQQNSLIVKQAIIDFNNQIYYNGLTSLPNRKLLQERFQEIISQDNHQSDLLAVAVLSLDKLDRFKDSLGIDCVDLLLQEAIERTESLVGEEDIVVRLNNEQLALILSASNNNSQIQKIATIVLEKIAEPLELLEYEVSISASMGIALYPQHGRDFDQLLKAASAASRVSSQQGGNRCELYKEAIQLKSKDRLILELSLRQAIEKNQFIAYYQPQLNLQTGKIVSAEALIRWQHPEKGRLSPIEFIPIAEETGLILAIDEWMLETACQQAKRLKTVGLNCTIAVNLSALQFQREDLSHRIAQILEQTGLNPHYLELEITESALVENAEAASAILRDLKALGIQISLDDFGTGYSSLSYLQEFPFDTLKIDRCFVQDLPQNSKNAAIIKAIVQMAASLNLKLVAEGVETEAEQEFLRENHCNLIQGYWFSPPVTAAKLENLLGIDTQLSNYSIAS